MKFTVDRNVREVYADVKETDTIIDLKVKLADQKCINPGDSLSFDTGFNVTIPEGFVGMLYAGDACREGTFIVNNIIFPDDDMNVIVKMGRIGSGYDIFNSGDCVAKLFMVPLAHQQETADEIHEN